MSSPPNWSHPRLHSGVTPAQTFLCTLPVVTHHGSQCPVAVCSLWNKAHTSGKNARPSSNSTTNLSNLISQHRNPSFLHLNYFLPCPVYLLWLLPELSLPTMHVEILPSFHALYKRRFSYEVFPNILPLLFILCQDVIKLSLANQS